MDLNVIKSYLISLGFKVDQPGITKFQNTLKDVSLQAERVSSGMAKNFVEAGSAIVGAFTAIGAATVGMMDHVAQADMGYQLLARRMFLTTEAARRMKMATDALGYSLEEIVWGPPELRDRYMRLIQAQKTMEGGLGGDFEGQMKHLRDFRFELTMVRVEVQYLLMALVSSVAKAFGTDTEGLLGKLRQFNAWVQQHIPEIVQKISQYLVPVLRDVWAVLKDIWEVGKFLAMTFVELWTALDPGSKVDEQTSNLEKFATALTEISHALRSVIDEFTRLQRLVGVGVGTGAGASVGASIGSLFGPIGTAIGAIVGGAGGFFGSAYLTHKAQKDTTGATSTSSDLAQKARTMAMDIGGQTGVDPSLIWAHWANETAGFTRLAGSNNLGGIKNKGGMGWHNYSSLEDFGREYVDIMSRNLGELRSARSGSDYATGLRDVRYFGNDYKSYMDSTKGISRWQPQYQGSYSVGDVKVYVTQPGASAEEIGRQTRKAVKDEMDRQVQRNMLNFQGPYSATTG